MVQFNHVNDFVRSIAGRDWDFVFVDGRHRMVCTITHVAGRTSLCEGTKGNTRVGLGRFFPL